MLNVGIGASRDGWAVFPRVISLVNVHQGDVCWSDGQAGKRKDADPRLDLGEHTDRITGGGSGYVEGHDSVGLF